MAIPGGPAGLGFRGGLSPLATALAVRGAVVMLADWRESPRWAGGYPVSFQDVACAIRTARAIAPEYGADPSKVTLVAHSFGGFAGAVVALAPKPIAPIAGECLQTSGSAHPDAYVGIAPISSLDDIGQDFLADFFGGPRSAQAASWAAADPLLLAAAPNRQAPPIRLVVGTSDGTLPPDAVAPFVDALRTAGKDVQLTSIDGASHEDLLVRPETIAVVMATAQR